MIKENETVKDKKELSSSAKVVIFAITAIGCAVIIGGSILAVQHNKQNSIEKQAQMKIDQENKVLTEEKAEEASNNLLYSWCLNDADDAYWSYVELNGTGKRDDENGVWANNSVWNRADERKQDAIDNCYKQYKK